MNLKELNLNKVNVLVGYPKYIKEFLDILIKSDLYFSEYKDKLITILKSGDNPPYIFITQSKEILEILASLLDKKENIWYTNNVM